MGETEITNSVVRFENIGCVIWSPLYKRYYYLRKDLGNLLKKHLLIEGKQLDNLRFVNNELLHELHNIGIDNDLRILDHEKKTTRPLYAPLEYYFDFTSRCNLHCSYCYNKNHLDQITMDPQIIQKIIEEMYLLGIQRLYLAGGEPTIDLKALSTYVDTAYQWGITTSMVTNGTLLTDDLCRYLLSRKLVDISVSIDGWDEESSLKKRNDGKFNEALNGIKKLVKVKKELGNNFTEICVKPVVDRNQNVDFFINMVELTLQIGADKVKFANPERSTNHPLGYYGKDVKKYYEMISIIENVKKQYEGRVIVTNVTNPCVGFGNIGLPGMHGCIGGQELIAINADGRITPCLMNHINLGNYYDYGSMVAFYNSSEKYNTYGDSINNLECHECSIYDNCRGGCQVRKYVERRKKEGKDPLCPIVNNIPIKKNLTGGYDILMPIRVSHSL